MGVVLLLERLLITDFERSIKTEDFGNGSKQMSNDRGVVFCVFVWAGFPKPCAFFQCRFGLRPTAGRSRRCALGGTGTQNQHVHKTSVCYLDGDCFDG